MPTYYGNSAMRALSAFDHGVEVSFEETATTTALSWTVPANTTVFQRSLAFTAPFSVHESLDWPDETATIPAYVQVSTMGNSCRIKVQSGRVTQTGGARTVNLTGELSGTGIKNVSATPATTWNNVSIRSAFDTWGTQVLSTNTNTMSAQTIAVQPSGTTVSHPWVRDTTPPTADGLNLTFNANSTVTIEVINPADSGGGFSPNTYSAYPFRYSLNGGTSGSNRLESTWTSNTLADGTYQPHVEVRDQVGNLLVLTAPEFTVPFGGGTITQRAKVHNGTAWVLKPAKRHNGTAWVEVQINPPAG